MSWEDTAACRDIPFFTELKPHEARPICHGCPVMDACLRDALDHELHTWRGSKNYMDTVRGGLSVYQRAKMLAALTVNVDGRLVRRQPA